MPPPSPQKSKRKRKPKRLRSEQKSVNGPEHHGPVQHVNKKRKKSPQPLRGMVVAISALHHEGIENKLAEVQQQKLETQHLSYRQVADLCKKGGATVTGQLHKKVQCLLCTSSAVQQETQRVRKAIKKNVPLVSLGWLLQSLHEERRLEFGPFLIQSTSLPRVSESGTGRATKIDNQKCKSIVPVDGDEDDEVATTGWSSPVTLGCCCSCHELGTKGCEWCVNCAG